MSTTWHLLTYQVCPLSGEDLELLWNRYAGAIASASQDGRESDIAEVEDLVSDFIKDPHCLILLVVSCESQYEFVVSLYDELRSPRSRDCEPTGPSFGPPIRPVGRANHSGLDQA